MEILAIHPGALGDIILALPALRILRDQFADAHITLAANTDFAATVASGYAERILSLASLPLHRLYGPEPIPQRDRLFWRSYDRILSWTGSDARSFAAQLASVHPCSLVAQWKPGIAEPRHVSRIFADSLRPWLSPPAALPAPGIAIDTTVRREGSGWLKDHGFSGHRSVFILHPGAGSITKRWPLSRFQDLARRMSAIGDLLVIEGPAEQGLGRELVEAIEPSARLAAHLPLPLLAAVMTQCRGFVGNDSGIAHLAAGLQIPCVVIFGPTLPQHWAPLGPQVSAIRDTGDCLACGQHAHTRHRCLENISVEAVWQTLECGQGSAFKTSLHWEIQPDSKN